MDIFSKKKEAGNIDSQAYRSLLELASLLQYQSNIEESIRLCIKRVDEWIPSATVTISIINPRTRETVKTVFAKGYDRDKRQIHFIQTNVAGWIQTSDRTFVTKNILHDPRFQKNLFQDIQIKKTLGVPLRSQGSVFGTILLLRTEAGHDYSDNEIKFLENVAVVISPYLQNIQENSNLFEPTLSEDVLLTKYQNLGLFGKSEAFIQLIRAVDAAAQTDVRVLLEGESGTGKELVARAIHKNGRRNGKPFVAIDCGAIPEHLIESELFGHTKGAFTGATKERQGLFGKGDYGTIFLDEITNLPLGLQSKLLRALQEGEFRPVGSSEVRKVDVRVIAAASVSVKKLVDENLFRQDLFYRLNVYPIKVPALRERQLDIPPLVFHFLEKFNSEQDKQVESIHPAVIDFLKTKSWPGNIRELENFIERIVTLAGTNTKFIDPSLLSHELVQFEEDEESTKIDIPIKPLKEQLADHELTLLRRALDYAGGNQSEAARLLKISESNIRYRMEKLGLK